MCVYVCYKTTNYCDEISIIVTQLCHVGASVCVRVCLCLIVCVCVSTSLCVWHTCCCRISSKQKLVSASPLLASPRLALARRGHPQHLLHTHEHGLWQPQTHTSTCTATLQNHLALTLLLSALAAAAAASIAAAVRFFASTLQPLTGREARLPRRRRGR